MYRSQKICIKRTNEMYDYFKQMSYDVTNLYNQTLYYIRQYATAKDSFENYCPLHANQLDVFTIVENITKDTKYSPKKKWLTYTQLDYIFKKTNNVFYRALPTQTSQNIIKLALRDINSFFEQMKSYKKNPSAFTGKPHLPHYKKREVLSTIVYSNQDCVFQQEKFLKFPFTKNKLNVGKLSQVGQLMEVKVKGYFDYFEVNLVLDCDCFDSSIENDTKNEDLLNEYKEQTTINERALSIDIGLSNLCAITNNFNVTPIIINGKPLKSINQQYNKQLANIKRIAKIQNKSDYTHLMSTITRKRNSRVLDYMHKTSHYIVNYAKENNVSLVVIGHSNYWKQEIELGKVTNQNFVSVPFNLLIQLLTYKLQAQGIKVVITEESYTSKASFVDGDSMPIYNAKENNPQVYVFSGKRIKRGLYRTKNGLLINADINGAANILRKVFPKVRQWDSGCVATPVVANIPF